jgi:23S rRNA G2445 N2-methylase RlmL
VVRDEVGRRLPGVEITRTFERFDRRTSLVLFRYGGAPRDLLGLRTIEDAFALIAELRHLPSGQAGLRAVRAALGSGRALDRALALAFQVRPRRRGKTTFRVIARQAGAPGFRRVDLQRAAERGLLDRFPAWRLVEDEAQIEVWVSLVGSTLIAGLRLSDNTMRQRAYRRTNLPASLKPTVARAMVLLSNPQAEDVFLDPMCGSGTILIERAQAARYRLLWGGDIDPTAVQATRDNLGPRYQPIDIRQWDARHLPLQSGSVSALVTNLPFGKQIGTGEDNRSLYPALLAEWSRVLGERGRMVLLGAERRLLRRSIEKQRLAVDRAIPVLVRGYPAVILVARRD